MKETNLITAAELRAALIRERRTMSISLNEAAKQCGVSASTLQRIEAGTGDRLPDMENIARICSWLGRSVDTRETVVSETGIEAICRVIRADKEIEDPDALCELMRTAYEAFAGKEVTTR